MKYADCEKATNFLHMLKEAHSGFLVDLGSTISKRAIAGRQILELEYLNSQEKVDPYQVRRRDRLARRHNFQYFGEPNENGLAFGYYQVENIMRPAQLVDLKNGRHLNFFGDLQHQSNFAHGVAVIENGPSIYLVNEEGERISDRFFKNEYLIQLPWKSIVMTNQDTFDFFNKKDRYNGEPIFMFLTKQYYLDDEEIRSKSSFLCRDGKEILVGKYPADHNYFSEGVVWIREKDGLSLYDENERRVCEIENFDRIYPFQMGFAWAVKKLSKNQFELHRISRRGEQKNMGLIIDTADITGPDSAGYFQITSNEQPIYFDKDGKVLAPMAKEGEAFYDGLARVRKLEGESEVENGYAIDFGVENEYSFIDTDGEKALGDYFLATDFSEGFAAVRYDKDDLWHIIDTLGKELEIEGLHNVKYDIWEWASGTLDEFSGFKEIGPFREGRAVARLPQKPQAFFVTNQGRIINPEVACRRIDPFENGVATAARLTDGEVIYLDRFGKQVLK